MTENIMREIDISQHPKYLFEKCLWDKEKHKKKKKTQNGSLHSLKDMDDI